VFHGEFDSTVDDKGRVILPARLRDEMGAEREEGFYVTFGPDGCVELCPPDEWDRRVEAMRGPKGQAILKARARRFKRKMSALTEKSTPDKQGRIRLHQNVLQKAGITKDVKIVGNFDTIEVWDRERYQQEDAESDREYRNDAEDLFTGPSEP